MDNSPAWLPEVTSLLFLFLLSIVLVGACCPTRMLSLDLKASHVIPVGHGFENAMMKCNIVCHLDCTTVSLIVFILMVTS